MTAKPANQIAFNSLKEKHPEVSANIFFWGSMHLTYPSKSEFVIKRLIPFATKWLHKEGFSVMSVSKNIEINKMWNMMCD